MVITRRKNYERRSSQNPTTNTSTSNTITSSVTTSNTSIITTANTSTTNMSTPTYIERDNRLDKFDGVNKDIRVQTWLKLYEVYTATSTEEQRIRQLLFNLEGLGSRVVRRRDCRQHLLMGRNQTTND